GAARDDPTAWTQETAEVREPTGNVGAHLGDGGLVAWLDPEERERDTDLVVERGRRTKHAVTRAERGCRGFRGRRLPDIAGDTDSRDGMRIAQRIGEAPEGVLSVRDLHDERARRQVRDGPLHDRSPGAVRERIRHEIVAVTLVA